MEGRREEGAERRSVILIGTAQGRRTEYFTKAARELGVSVRLLEWDRLSREALEQISRERAAVKIDPPVWESCRLEDLGGGIRAYLKNLERLGTFLPKWQEEGEDAGKGYFLNTPQAIGTALDKRRCKEQLKRRGVPVTEMLAEEIVSGRQLQEIMRKQRIMSVFVKPVFSSGAAGILAYRYDPARGKMAAYTSCRLEQGTLINTKKLYRIEHPGEIASLLDAILSLGAVVERWYPKAMSQGYSYDLRAVYQFGRLETIIARGSRGPITNLHLNNTALDLSGLGLPEKTLSEVRELCKETLKALPGLQSAGIDILVEKDTYRPYVIEVNGQGDLIYQDIFQKNAIYRHQIEYLTGMKG